MSRRSKSLQNSVVFLALILLLFLLTTTALTFLPQDLSDLEGRPETQEAVDSDVRNLTKVLSNAVSEDLAVTLTEEELNQWLSTQVGGQQGGPFANSVSYKGSWVRLKENSFDIIIERNAFGRPHTVAMSIGVEQLVGDGNSVNTHLQPQGGRLGQLPVPQGYLHLVMPSYESLLSTVEPEINSLRQLFESGSRISFKEGKVLFQPAQDESGPEQLLPI